MLVPNAPVDMLIPPREEQPKSHGANKRESRSGDVVVLRPTTSYLLSQRIQLYFTLCTPIAIHNNTMSDLPPNTRAALRHLQVLKPTDGYSAETYQSSSGKTQILLRRRTVQLGDSGFQDIVLDPDTKCVVGITEYIDPLKKYARGVVLVEKNGSVCRDHREAKRVTVPNANTTANNHRREPPTAARQNAQQHSIANPSAIFSDAVDAIAALTRGDPLTSQHNMALIYSIGSVIVATAVLKVIMSALFLVWMLAFPLVYLYGVQTCPTNASFDAKKELKRVMRGHQLPEDHPDKPKGWLAENLARVAATVTTELATGLSGYEVEMWDVAGAAKVATVRVASINAECVWIGWFGRWTYVYQREMEPRAGN